MALDPSEVDSFDLPALVKKHIPDLDIHDVLNSDGTSLGYEWTYRCVESDAYYETWRLALVDFIKEQADLIDKHIGVGAEDDE